MASVNELERMMKKILADQAASDINNRLTAMSNTPYGGGSNSTYNPDGGETEGIPPVKAKDININEAKDIIVPLLETGIVPFLWGPPGLGKSTLVSDRHSLLMFIHYSNS